MCLAGWRRRRDGNACGAAGQHTGKRPGRSHPHLRLDRRLDAEGIESYVADEYAATFPDGESETFNCSVVNFACGATTGWHIHDCDQILVVTKGIGIVATEAEQRQITVGDVVHIKAGENHWHGARTDTAMSHITITAVGGKVTKP